MLSTLRKDKKRRSLVKKYQIKNLYAKVFQQDRSLKEILQERSRATRDLLNSDLLKPKVKDTLITKQRIALDWFLYEKAIENIPRNSSKTRIRNRCIESGKSRSVLRFCKLSRIVLREQASKGEIPGVSKASW